MPSLLSWISSNPHSIADENTTLRAELAWRRINDRPTSIQFHRNGVDLDAQLLRIEYSDESRLQNASSSVRGVSKATLFGVRGHSEISDTDVQQGDRFVINNRVTFEVVAVMLVPGEVQAICEVSNG